MKKKVIQFIHGMSMGGAETLVKEYCTKLDKKIFDIILLCLDYCNMPYEEILEKTGIKVIYLSKKIEPLLKSRIELMNKVKKRILLVKYINKILKEERPDIIHTHLTINKYLVFTKLPKTVKIIHTVHSEPKSLWNSSFHGKIDKICLQILSKKYQVKFIVLHNKMKEEVDKMFKINNSIILNNGTDFKKYENLESKEEIRKKENIPSNSFVVGHVGRFSKEKNHKLIIKIFKELVKLKKNCFLLLVGDGDEKENIIKSLNDANLNGKFKILSNRTDIPRLMKSMDIFILPSIYEGLPISLVEAQKSKLKCIVSNSISKAVDISNLIQRINLDEPIETWVKAIMNFKVDKVQYYNLEDWDINKNVKQLEKIYLED